jgi:membrane-bound ClpP family serine protease
MGMALQGLGGIFGLIAVVGWIWLLIMIFQQGDIIWGIAGIFCGLLALIWGLTHMETARQPLLIFVVGIVGGTICNIAAVAMAGAG